jgi:hypothetical protein
VQTKETALKVITILLIAAALLGGSTPTVAAPAPAPASACWAGPPLVYQSGQARCWRGVPYVLPVEIRATVEGSYPSGVVGPIGEYTAVGASLGEATSNAQQREAGIRTQATAQAVRP